MKYNNLLSLFLFSTLTALFSCSNDDNKNSSPTIIGKWQVTTVEGFGCTNSIDNVTWVCGTYTWCVTLELKSNNTFTATRISDGGSNGSGTYVLSGSTLTLTYVDNPVHETSPRSSAVTLSGNSLSLVYLPSTPPSNGCSTRTTYTKM